MRFIKRHAILVSILVALVVLIGVPLLFYFVPSLSGRLFEAIMFATFAALLVAASGAGYNTWRVLRCRKKRNWTWIPSLIFALLCLLGFAVLLSQYVAML